MCRPLSLSSDLWLASAYGGAATGSRRGGCAGTRLGLRPPVVLPCGWGWGPSPSGPAGRRRPDGWCSRLRGHSGPTPSSARSRWKVSSLCSSGKKTASIAPRVARCSRCACWPSPSSSSSSCSPSWHGISNEKSSGAWSCWWMIQSRCNWLTISRPPRKKLKLPVFVGRYRGRGGRILAGCWWRVGKFRTVYLASWRRGRRRVRWRVRRGRRVNRTGWRKWRRRRRGWRRKRRPRSRPRGRWRRPWMMTAGGGWRKWLVGGGTNCRRPCARRKTSWRPAALIRSAIN